MTQTVHLIGIPGDQYHINANTGWIIAKRDSVLDAYNFNKGSHVIIPDVSKSSLYACTGIWSGGNDLIFKSINTYDRPPILLFSLESQRMIKEIENPFVDKSGLACTIKKIVVSEDDQYLIAQLQGDHSRMVIWVKDAKEYQILGQIVIPRLSDFQYSPITKEVFIQNDEGIYVFTIDPAAWGKRARSIANRALTSGEIANHNLQD